MSSNNDWHNTLMHGLRSIRDSIRSAARRSSFTFGLVDRIPWLNEFSINHPKLTKIALVNATPKSAVYNLSIELAAALTAGSSGLSGRG